MDSNVISVFKYLWCHCAHAHGNLWGTNSSNTPWCVTRRERVKLFRMGNYNEDVRTAMCSCITTTCKEETFSRLSRSSGASESLKHINAPFILQLDWWSQKVKMTVCYPSWKGSFFLSDDIFFLCRQSKYSTTIWMNDRLYLFT